ncbi:30S ribosomal protein S16 [Rhynchospora pubera]|uniref:30S ribosomal protein S16 n=2 Tax=Rhynchospora pubera TaxID=906938 RepID=A0AAV8FVK4_9POAL|nr:30S ribosomal protein S16 [Rhynchospora pubera]
MIFRKAGDEIYTCLLGWIRSVTVVITTSPRKVGSPVLFTFSFPRPPNPKPSSSPIERTLSNNQTLKPQTPNIEKQALQLYKREARLPQEKREERRSIQRSKEKRMAVRIRLARFGCRNRPFYRVMAADSRSPRDGKHLEVLGYYNPLPGQDGGKRMGLNFDRIKYWLSVGAQPSDPVQRLLFRAGLLPPPPMLAMARKGGPRDRRPVDPMTGRYLTVPDAEEESIDEHAQVEEEEEGEKLN